MGHIQIKAIAFIGGTDWRRVSGRLIQLNIVPIICEVAVKRSRPPVI